MSLLNMYSRHQVMFDPENKEHRQWYHHFVQTGAWGRCPYQFVMHDDHGSDLITRCQRALIRYYVNREFGDAPKVPTNKSRSKP